MTSAEGNRVSPTIIKVHMVNTKNRELRYKIFMAIARHDEGLTIPELVEETGISYQVINNILKKDELGKKLTISHIVPAIENKTSTGYRQILKFKIIDNPGENTICDWLSHYYEELDGYDYF